MTQSTFQPTVLGLTAFIASNRIDFVLDGPDLEKPERCSAFYDAPERKLKLDGKALKIVGVDTDSDGEPARLTVKHGRNTLVLGRRRNASGPVSFYRSLEPSNNADAPKSADEVLAALSSFIGVVE